MKKRTKILIGIWLGIILINLLAWCSSGFCAWYVTHLFPVWVNTYGRLIGIFPFSVGEWMLYLAVLYITVNLILCIPAWFLHKRGRGKKLLAWLAVTPWFVTLVCVLMTLNCTILYHCTTLKAQFSEAVQEQADGTEGEVEASLEQLIALREKIVINCNRLSKEMPRDGQGYIAYEVSAGENGQDAFGTSTITTEYDSLASEAILAMHGIADEFPRLSGYYPNPKPLAASWFFSQQYMCGYYFPFSMEANYNDVMSIMKKPATMCHELAHIRGYIYEDEANFIAFLACVESDDAAFQYSGYLSVLNYVANDLYKTRLADPESYAAAREAVRPLQVLQQVREDNIFVTEAEWERINGKAVVDTETVDSVSDTLTDASLKLNGVPDGMISYNRVVELLLQWYGQQGEY